jgi:hypothetical protein
MRHVGSYGTVRRSVRRHWGVARRRTEQEVVVEVAHSAGEEVAHSVVYCKRKARCVVELMGPGS